jgi:glycosidase
MKGLHRPKNKRRWGFRIFNPQGNQTYKFFVMPSSAPHLPDLLNVLVWGNPVPAKLCAQWEAAGHRVHTREGSAMWKGKEDFPNGIPQVAFVTDWEDGEAQATRLLALEELGVNYVFLHLVGPSRAQASADWGLEGVGQVSGLQWVAWNAWPDALESLLWEVVPAHDTPDTRLAWEGLAGTLGVELVFCPDRGGMVTPRVLACIMNEAYRTMDEGVAAADAIDLGMRYGTNYPQGPLEWSRAIGPKRLARALDAWHAAATNRNNGTQDEIYRVAEGLRLAAEKVMLWLGVSLAIWGLSPGSVQAQKTPPSTTASFLLPGRPSPVNLKGWETSDTTVVNLEDYLRKTAGVLRDVRLLSGWAWSLSRDGRLLNLYPQATHSLRPAERPAVWLLGLDLANGEVLDLPVKAPLHTDVVFRYQPLKGQQVDSVTVVGDFNGWNDRSHPLRWDSARGEWRLVWRLNAGSYPYQLVVNGQWMLDPANPMRRDNGIGGVNSLLRIMPGGGPAPALDVLEEKDGMLRFAWAYRPGGALVFWENRCLARLEADPGSGTAPATEWTLKIPEEALSRTRSHLRIYTYGPSGPGNDLLLPLSKGQLIRSPQQLTRHDAEAQRMYFVFVDRFANGDSTNDRPVRHPEVHPKANFMGGDLQGVLNKIQEGYFDRMGINSLWISPIVQNPEGPYREWPKPNRMYSGYHGYWPISSSRVDRRFGDEALLKRLIDTAHAHGINVLLDYVANHVHQEHPLLVQHPDWITTLDLPDGRKNIRIWDEHRLTTWFDTFMPSLDLERPEVYQTMSDSALFWLEKFPLDGFRHDATKHIPEVFWRTLTRKIKERIVGPQGRSIYQIGETFGSRQLIGSYVGSGMIDAQFDFNFYFDARSALASDAGNMGMIRQTLEESHLYYGHQHSMGNISGNHDMPRFIAYASGALRMDEDPIAAGWNRQVEGVDTLGFHRLRLLQTLIATIPGVPVLYYGDEWGMMGAGDPDNRRMMRFEGWNRAQQETMDHCRNLMQVRSSSMALQYGTTHFLWERSDALVMSRRYLGEDVWVVWNRSAKPLVTEIDLNETLEQRLGTPTSPNQGHNLPLPASVKDRLRMRFDLKLLAGQGQAVHVGKGRYQIQIPPYSSAVLAHP